MRLVNILFIFALWLSACSEIEDASNKFRADQLMKSGKYEEALEIYDQEIENNKEDWESLYRRGVLFQMIGDHELALIDFNASNAVNSSNFSLYQSRAFSNTELGNYDAALSDLEIFKEHVGDTPRLKLLVANIYYGKGQFDKAIQVCEEGLLEFPDDSELQNFLC